jgi:ubiquinol-cytochrome c reductase cytochrome c1 subunit
MRIESHPAAAAATLLALALLPAIAPAEQGEHGGLLPAHTDVSDHASLQRGARNFINYCSGCHSAVYVRYNRIGADLGIADSQLREDLIFNAATKVSDTIRSSMPAADAQRWFGVVPPDLSLIARARDVDYLYTFLKSFYADPARPTGVNNTVLEGTAMPHVLAGLQGVQQAVFRKETTRGDDGTSHEAEVFDKFAPGSPGSLTPEAYDSFVRDTVNFLQYIGEPAAEKRERLGIWVILFLLVFTVFARALYKNYWKEVH